MTNDFTNPDIGHNEPPTLQRYTAEELAALVADYAAEADTLSAVADTALINSPETAEKVKILVAKIRDHAEAVDARREDVKKPYLEQQRLIDAAYFGITKPLDAKRKALLDMLTRWKDAEDARIAAERRAQEAEARRLQEEAEAKRRAAEQAPTSTAERLAAIRAEEEAALAARRAATVRPDPAALAASGVSMRGTIHCEIDDPRKAFAWLLKRNKAGLVAALEDLALKQLRPLGLKVVEETSAEDFAKAGLKVSIRRQAQVRG